MHSIWYFVIVLFFPVLLFLPKMTCFVKIEHSRTCMYSVKIVGQIKTRRENSSKNDKKRLRWRIDSERKKHMNNNSNNSNNGKPNKTFLNDIFGESDKMGFNYLIFNLKDPLAHTLINPYSIAKKSQPKRNCCISLQYKKNISLYCCKLCCFLSLAYPQFSMESYIYFKIIFKIQFSFWKIITIENSIKHSEIKIEEVEKTIEFCR